MDFSVIIPTCHRNDDLAKCLEYLAPGRQEGGCLSGAVMKKGSALFTYEVVVSDDGRESTAKAMIAERFPWACWVEGPKRGPAANRNNGAKHAKGKWLVFVDDDCYPSHVWLVAIHNSVIQTNVDVIEGKTIIPHKKDDPFLHAVENLDGDCYWSCNLTVRKSVFDKIGRFDEDFLEAGGEDMEFAWRLRKYEIPSFFSQEALVFHPQRCYSIKGFFKRVHLLRWIRLYRLKTGEGLPLSTPKPKVILEIIISHFLSIIRRTFLLFRKWDSRTWRTSVFTLVWSWLVMPYQIPLLIYWELKFRRLIGDGIMSVRITPQCKLLP